MFSELTCLCRLPQNRPHNHSHRHRFLPPKYKILRLPDVLWKDLREATIDMIRLDLTNNKTLNTQKKTSSET